jgi:hypothetical protein
LERVLTRDNTLLSRPTSEALNPPRVMVVRKLAPALADPVCASTCTDYLVRTVNDYIDAGIAPATRRAYRTDLDHFEAWGGTFPSTEVQLANYLVDHATVLKVSTLTRRLAGISIA